MRIGDRVSYPASLSFGRGEATWVGTIVSMATGVPACYGVDDSGASCLIETAYSAPWIHVDVPQHGLLTHLTHTPPNLVRATDLTLVEACSDETHNKLAALYPTYMVVAMVCACPTCRTQQAREIAERQGVVLGVELK